MWHHISCSHQHNSAAALQHISNWNIGWFPQTDSTAEQLLRSLITEGVWCGGTRQGCSECPPHKSVCMLNFMKFSSCCCSWLWQDRPWNLCVSCFFVKGEMLTQWSSIYTVEHPVVVSWGAFPETQTAAGQRWLICSSLGLTWWNAVAAASWWSEKIMDWG